MKKIALLTATLLTIALPAVAQESQIFLEPGTEYDNRGVAIQNLLKQQSFTTTNKEPAGIVHLSIVHPDYLEPHQFGLLMTKANSITDCFDYSPFQYEAKYIEGNYMDVKVHHYRKTVNATQKPHFDCDMKSKVISGLMILDAHDLKRKGIRKIRFNNGEARDTYSVSIMDKAVRLTPESMMAFKAQNLKGADNDYMQYDFVDNTLVKLQVPMAENSDDIMQAVRDLARRHALEPVLEHGSIDLNADSNAFYFKDYSGNAVQKIGSEGYADFGTINVNRPYDGPSGRVAMPVPLRVFLTRTNVTL